MGRDKPVHIFVFVNALGWERAQEFKFMEGLLPFQSRLDGCVLGGQLANLATTLSGKLPSGHECFLPFYFDAEHSPLRPFRLVKYAFGAGLHPKCLMNTQPARKILSLSAAKFLALPKYFNVDNIPYDNLSCFNFNRQNPSRQNGLSNAPTLADFLFKHGVNYFISDPFDNDGANFDKCRQKISEGADFVFLSFSGFEKKFSEKADSALAKRELARISENIAQLNSLVCEGGRECVLNAISGCGMEVPKKLVDIQRMLKGAGMRFGKDYAAFLDAKLAVFWYVNENAAKVIRTCLSKLDDCGRFLDSSDKAEYGLLGRREIFGDDIFLCENGVQISPSYLSRLPMAAVGATPKNSQMFCGFIFSNRKHSKIPSHLSGVFDFMKICAQNANK